MKKNCALRAAFAFFSAALMSLALASCSNASGDAIVQNGNVALLLDSAFFQKAVQFGVQKNGESEVEGEKIKMRLEVSLNGEYSDTKTLNFDFEKTAEAPLPPSQTINFNEVPIGKNIYAVVRIYVIGVAVEEGKANKPSYIGKSKTIQVGNGDNTLELTAYSYYTSVPYSVKVEFDSVPKLSANSNMILACSPDSEFVKKLKAAKNNVERYEACRSVDLQEVSLAVLNSGNYTLDEKTLSFTGVFYLPVSESEPDSKGADVVFLFMSCNAPIDEASQSGNYKTMYFGMADASSVPVKKQSNSVSFNATSLGVSDTKYAMYKIDDLEYKYYLTEDASDPLDGDPVFNSMGTTGSFGSYEQSSCFDASGKLYSLSITPDEGSVYIKSNNPNITSGSSTGVYECVDGDGGWINYNAISCDIKNNELFMFREMYSVSTGYTYILYGTGDFLETGVNKSDAYVLKVEEAGRSIGRDIQSVKRGSFAVFGGTAYFVAQAEKIHILKADLSTKTESSSHSYGLHDYDVNMEVVAEIPLPEDVSIDDTRTKITDMLYQDGAVYLLLRDFEDGISGRAYMAEKGLYYNSRGALIKCVVSSGATKTIGWTENPQDYSNAGFYTSYKNNGFTYNYFTADCSSSGWKDASKMFKIPGNSTRSLPSGALVKDALPKLFSPSSGEASKAFYGPQKFVAIKPKQLVIADNGVAFYTDNGGYRSKRAHRVVTVDLEAFAISGTPDVSATFESAFVASIYASAFGNLNTYMLSPNQLVDELWISNGSKFTSAQGDAGVFLYVPGDEE